MRARACVREPRSRCQRIAAAQWRREEAARPPLRGNFVELLLPPEVDPEIRSEAMEAGPATALLLCLSLRLSLDFVDTHLTHLDDAIDYKDPCKAGRVCVLMTSSCHCCLYNVDRQLQAVGLNVGLRDATSNLESSQSKSLPCFYLVV